MRTAIIKQNLHWKQKKEKHLRAQTFYFLSKKLSMSRETISFFLSLPSFLSFFLSVFLGAHLWHMEVRSQARG